MTKLHLIGHIVYAGLYGILIASAISCYNSANLAELLYAGWAILTFGIIFLLWSSKSRKKRYRENISKSRETFVESGTYAFVRHPEFLSHILIIFALIVISQHWISLAVGTILIVLLCLAMVEEERRNIEKFGDAYKDYMKRVPRINLVAGIVGQMRSGRGNKRKSG